MKIEKLREMGKLPVHIAFIIDGNGRWAKKRGFERMIGHKFGFKNLQNTIDYVAKSGIKYMSVYCFSTENWNRPKPEVDGLMDIFKTSFKEDVLKCQENNIKVVFSGDKTRLAPELQQVWEETTDKTMNNTGLVLNLCFNYGGRQEIVQAVNKLIASGAKSVTMDDISNNLYTAGMPDPDLVIRTSGELRTSNFMPWQTTYAEWYFPKTLWPAFTRRDFEKALNSYAKRDRRHGAIKGK